MARLSREAFERIASATRAVEGSWTNESARGAGPRRSTSPALARVQVTGPVSSGLYPCTFQTRDVTQTPPAWSPLGTGWAEGPNGETLATNTYYLGMVEGVNPADGNPVVMVVVGAAAAGVARVQITGPVSGVYFPCTFQMRDTTQLPPVWLPEGPGWAEGFNGEFLGQGTYYGGVLEGTHPFYGTPLIQVFTSGTGYTGTRMLCERDGFLHTYIYKNGILKTVDGAMM